MSPSGAEENPPSTDDPTSVVEWFLRRDEGIAGHLSFAATLAPSVFWETRTEILKDLRQFDDAESLAGQAAFLIRRWRDVVARAKHAIEKHGGPESVPEADQAELGRLAVSQAILAARVRILGHFLQERYGVDSAGIQAGAGGEADPT